MLYHHLEEAFASGEAAALSPLQREGRIVLLFRVARGH